MLDAVDATSLQSDVRLTPLQLNRLSRQATRIQAARERINGTRYRVDTLGDKCRTRSPATPTIRLFER